MRSAVWMAVVGAVFGVGLAFEAAARDIHMPGDRVRLGKESWGCDKEARGELSSQHDFRAFSRLMARFRAQGRCLVMAPGTVVDVMDVSLYDGQTAVRIKGHPETWWMTTSIISETGKKIGEWTR